MSLDLWGYGFRTAAVDEWGNPGEVSDEDWQWINGGCLDWALAHQKAHPHLRFGIDWEVQNQDNPGWSDYVHDTGGDINSTEDEHCPMHVFTHDDHWGYDIRGAFPLDKFRQWHYLTLNHSLDDVTKDGDLGVRDWDGDDPPGPELIGRNPPRPPIPGGGFRLKKHPLSDPGNSPLWERLQVMDEDDHHTASRPVVPTTPRATIRRDRPTPRKARTMTAAVTVYTQPNCVQCTMTKKQLDKLGIEHDTVDVTADPEAHAYVTGLGYTAAPVVVVNNGESHWAGFRPERLKELVGGE